MIQIARKTVGLLVLVLVGAGASVGHAQSSQSQQDPLDRFQSGDYHQLDFSDWDPALLSSDGGTQVFENVIGDIDVTVTARGDFDGLSTYVSTTGGSAIRTHLDASLTGKEQSYEFCFSSPFEAIVEMESLDSMEEFEVSANGAMTVTPLLGSAPTISSTMNGVLLDGNGLGVGASGASTNWVSISPSSMGQFCITTTYRVDPNMLGITKYGSFRILSPVPEPNTAGLAAMGLLGALGCLRRGRRRQNLRKIG